MIEKTEKSINHKTCNDCINSDLCIYKTHQPVCRCFKDKSRYIGLPCAVGDTVYCLYKECQKETKIIELEIDFFEIHKDYVIINGYKGEYCYRYFTREIGKTVFLTKEEAEQILQAHTSRELDYVEAKDLDKDSPEFKEALESFNRL